MKDMTLAVRQPDFDNPNHHLWNNNGTWWLHCTVHFPDYTSKRLRCSLGTAEVELARIRRDRFFATLESGESRTTDD